MNKHPAIYKAIAISLCVIFIGITLHTPVVVMLVSIFSDYSLVLKSWKEILIISTAIITSWIIFRDGSYKVLLKDKLVRVILIYCVLHFFLLAFKPQGFLPATSGLMIDLRYVIFCLLVYVWMLRYPPLKRYALNVVSLGAAIVCGFAVLQVFVLPYDILSYIGYNKDTIIPYLLVDNNYDFIRINSTLRGPNPLGAYAVIVIAAAFAYLFSVKRQLLNKRSGIFVVVLLLAAVVALWSSYSRGGLIAGIFAIGVIVSARLLPMVSKKYILIGLGAFGGLALAAFMNSNSYFVSHVLLHEDPTTSATSLSNMQHIESLKEGANRMAQQPLGGGIGSTGSASLLGSRPLIIENQYLFIAHESGWMGLITFLYLLGHILKNLWFLRFDWLSLSLFASGLGLSIIGLFLPVWSDDTVSIIWWGLAGLALASHNYE